MSDDTIEVAKRSSTAAQSRGTSSGEKASPPAAIGAGGTAAQSRHSREEVGVA